MGTFKRKESIYDIPRVFADEKIKRCAFCKTWEPKWLVREEWKLSGRNYYFKCPQCESILRTSEADVTGLSFTTKTFQGQWKKYKGKDLRRIYFTIEKIGLSVKTPENMIYEGAEVTLSQLAAISRGEKR